MHLNMTFGLFLATIFSRGFGQAGHVDLLSAASCSSNPDDSNFGLSITTLGDQKCIVSLTAKVEEFMDLNKLQYKAEVFIKEHDNYKELITLKGNLCGFIRDILDSEWDRIRSAVVPEFGDPCEIAQGTYELNAFEMNLDNTNLGRLTPTGQVKVVIEVNREEDTSTCFEFELLKE